MPFNFVQLQLAQNFCEHCKNVKFMHLCDATVIIVTHPLALAFWFPFDPLLLSLLCKEDYDKLLEYKERCRELIIENEVLTDKYKKVLELSSAKLKDEMRRKRENNRSPGVKEEARGRLRSRSRTRSLSPRNRNNSGVGEEMNLWAHWRKVSWIRVFFWDQKSNLSPSRQLLQQTQKLHASWYQRSISRFTRFLSTQKSTINEQKSISSSSAKSTWKYSVGLKLVLNDLKIPVRYQLVLKKLRFLCWPVLCDKCIFFKNSEKINPKLTKFWQKIIKK